MRRSTAPEDVRRFVESTAWRFAKTYAEDLAAGVHGSDIRTFPRRPLMSSIARTSAGVNRWGDVCGQDDSIVQRTRMPQQTPGMEPTRRQS